MKLTTKGRYAVTAMLDMTLHHNGKAVSLADISSRQNISLSYLEQLFGKLRKRGLVISSRGPGGGYSLRYDAAHTYISDIIQAVEEPLDARKCKGKGNCGKNGKSCLTHELWNDLSKEIENFLNSVSLADLINKRT
jgi:Rrf2 family transcriptional regulator, iron-sulfur cluster assembly transcription factor